MATITEPWDENAQIRHAAKVIWPSLFGRDKEYLRLCERLRELGYDGTVESIHYESIIQAWRKAEWVLLSPDGMHVRLTPKGKEQFEAWEEEERIWRTGGTDPKPVTKQPVSPESVKIRINQPSPATNKDETDMAAVRSLLDDVSKLEEESGVKSEALTGRARMIITKVFGKSSPYLDDLAKIKFHGNPYDSIAGRDKGGPWRRGKQRFTDLCNTMLEDLRLTESRMTASKPKSKRIFVVHGHDNEMKQAVARTVEKLGLEAVILHEQVNKGAPTIIEKLLNNSDVGFGIILLSPDDVGYPKSSPDKPRPRPRQNVIFEFGLFVGKLGRKNVFVLFRKAPDFEMLTDFAGGIYQEFDDAGAWRYELGRELKAAGYDIDLNKLSS